MLEQTIKWMSEHRKVPLYNQNGWSWWVPSAFKTNSELPVDIYSALSKVHHSSGAVYHATFKESIDNLGQALAKLGLIHLSDIAKSLPSFDEWLRASQCSPGLCKGTYYFVSDCSPSYGVETTVRLPNGVFCSLNGRVFDYMGDFTTFGGKKVFISNGKIYTSKEAAMEDLKQVLVKLGIVQEVSLVERRSEKDYIKFYRAKDWMRVNNKEPIYDGNNKRWSWYNQMNYESKMWSYELREQIFSGLLNVKDRLVSQYKKRDDAYMDLAESLTKLGLIKQ